MTLGTLPHLTGLLPDGHSCTTTTDAGGPVLSAAATETQICLQTLGALFGSGCAATLQLTPCLCGAANVSQCIQGLTVPSGPLYDVYACDFDTASSATIQQDFSVQSFGAGQANSLVQCAAAFGCDCF
jgi:hypothetical protein